MSPPVLLMLAIFLWSTAFVAIRVALQDYSPGSVALFRFLIASLCLLGPYLKLSKRQPIILRTSWLLFLIGPIGIAGYSLLLNQGELVISAGIACFVVSLTPVFSSVLAILILKESASPKLFLGLGVSFLGLLLIALGDVQNLQYDFALLLILMAAFFGAIQSISQKIVLRHLSGLEVVALGTWFAALVLLVYSRDLIQDFQMASWNTTLACLYLGIIPSFVAQWCWSHALSSTQLVHANSYLFAMPLLTTLIGFMVLGEVPAGLSFAGGLVAIIGALITKAHSSLSVPCQDNSNRKN